MMVGSHRILIGDVLAGLATLPDQSVHCCVTSPPYWGLRDYGVAGQIGLEPTPDAYVARMVGVFREVRRVLRDDGTLWLNIGDTYNGYMANQRATSISANNQESRPVFESGHGLRRSAVKSKDLIGIPWRVAFALQADGWYLRSDIIWAKPNPMPESVTDRPTKAHEYLFLLSKSERYYYDQAAIMEPATFDGPNGRQLSPYAQGFARRTPEEEQERRVARSGNKERKPASARGVPIDTNGNTAGAVAGSVPWVGSTRNKRTVWTVATKPFPEAHFATFPPELIEPCILAGCPEGGTVLDPFSGSGTTGAVACPLGRNYIGCELNPEYAAMSERRIGRAIRPSTFRDDKAQDAPLFGAMQ